MQVFNATNITKINGQASSERVPISITVLLTKDDLVSQKVMWKQLTSQDVLVSDCCIVIDPTLNSIVTFSNFHIPAPWNIFSTATVVEIFSGLEQGSWLRGLTPVVHVAEVCDGHRDPRVQSPSYHIFAPITDQFVKSKRLTTSNVDVKFLKPISRAASITMHRIAVAADGNCVLLLMLLTSPKHRRVAVEMLPAARWPSSISNSSVDHIYLTKAGHETLSSQSGKVPACHVWYGKISTEAAPESVSELGTLSV